MKNNIATLFVGEGLTLAQISLRLVEEYEVVPEKALMIGDSISDVKAARAAGFQIICMSYGYNHGEDIRNYNPDLVIDSMAELQGVL